MTIARGDMELLQNGDFSGGTDGWTLDRLKDAKAAFTVEEEDGKKVAHVSVPEAAEVPYHVQLFQGGFQVTSGEIYRLSFRARSQPGVKIVINVMQSGAPWKVLWKQEVELSPDWQPYSFEVLPSEAGGNARVTFSWLGVQAADYWFSDVSLDH